MSASDIEYALAEARRAKAAALDAVVERDAALARVKAVEAEAKTYDALAKVIEDIQAEPMDSKLERAWGEAKRWRARAEGAEAALRAVAEHDDWSTPEKPSVCGCDGSPSCVDIARAYFAATPTEDPHKRLEELAASADLREENWDSYGAEPLRDEAVDLARRLAPLLDGFQPVPTVEGGIGFEDPQGRTVEVWTPTPPREP